MRSEPPIGRSSRAASAPEPYRYAELAKLPRSGGTAVVFAPAPVAEVAPDLQFVSGDSSRVYFFEQGSGALMSVALDGTQRREHLKFEGLGLGATGQRSGVAVWRALLSRDGRSLLVQHDLVQHDGMSFGQIDWIDLGGIDLRGEAVEPVPIAGPGGTVSGDRVRRLSTRMGGVSPFWSQDETRVYFAVADHLFLTTPDAVSPPTEAVGRLGLTLPRKESGGAIVFRDARILTMAGRDIPRGDLVVVGDRIKAVGESGTLEIPDDARVIDATGKTIMPGLISSHAHQYEVGEIGPLDSVGWELMAKLAYGVTTVLDPASPLAIYSFSDLEQAGAFAGPRIVRAGPLVSWPDDLYSPADAATLVRRNALYGDCCIKVYDIGGRLNRQWMYRAAQDAGIIAIPETEGSLNASLTFILDGVSHLSHGLQLPVYDDVRQLFGQSGSSISYQLLTLVGNCGPSAQFHFFETELNEKDPRVMQWIPSEYFRQHNRRRLHVPPIEQVFPMYGRQLAKLIDAGLKIHTGEHGVAHGLANHWAVWALAKGAGNRRALQAATIDGAYAMGVEQHTGSLEAGKLADLLVLDGDPLQDIRATERLVYVMRDGDLYDPMTLERLWPEPARASYRWWADDQPQMRPGSQLSGIGNR